MADLLRIDLGEVLDALAADPPTPTVPKKPDTPDTPAKEFSMYLRATSAFLTSLVNGISGGTLKDVAMLNANTGETANASGLRLVGTQPPADRAPAFVPGSSAAIAGYINTGSQTITPPAGYGPVWLEIPVSWVRTLFAGTGITPPTSGPLQLSTECALDARGGWENWLVQSGLFASFSNPTALPMPSVSA